MKPIYNSLFLGLLLTIQAAYAADPVSPSQSYSFRAIAWDEVISDLKFSTGDNKTTALNILPNGCSPAYQYKSDSDQTLVFFRENPKASGAAKREAVASLPVTQLYAQTLLMFFGVPGQPGRYTVQALDDSATALSADGYCFINFSKVPLAIKCGEDSGIAPAGKALVLPGKPSDGGQVTGVEIVIITEGGAKKRVYSNRWPYDDKTRSSVFILQDPATQSFVLKRIHANSGTK